MTDRPIHATHTTTNDESIPMNTAGHDNTNTNDTVDEAAALRRAKVEALQKSKGRKHVAQGSKIAATAVGITAMLGLVGAMGAAARANATPPAPAPAVPAQVTVVIHPAGAAGTAPTAVTATGAVVATPAQPIVLSAQPVVRQAAPSPAPAAKTHGSR